MNIHFIALGGSIMHSLAIALQDAGHTVTGSDDKFYNPSRARLEAFNLLPEEGWHPERIHANLDVVILGMHAFPDNPELLKAQELDLPIQSFPEFIYQQSKYKKRVVVAGSYGKTTTTGMIMHALQEAGKEFDYVVGAQIPGFDNPVRLSDTAPILVVEGDEYLASRIDPQSKFLHYEADIISISGLAWDHINVFPTLELYHETFRKLIKKIPENGLIIYNEKEADLKEMVAKEAPDKAISIPYACPEYIVERGKFVIHKNDIKYPLSMFGKHNMENMAAAAEICKNLGVGEDAFFSAMEHYQGAHLRQDIVIDQPGLRVYRDYAHAPDKVEATLNAVRELFPKSHITAVVELHTFSSLDKNFLQNYSNTLRRADESIVIVDAQTLERKRKEPISEEEIFAYFNKRTIRYLQDVDHISAAISHARAHGYGNHQVVLLMSSGNFGGMDIDKLAN
ncbi:MAG: UDP-N-acetylmuramate--L-alanine ligase [Bacteroidia bacterium]